ncbi:MULTISPECIES: DUF4864 domain-containing protein [Roseobacteraceae]|jgi:hypothetical protein|uniref:DUF4864 domain-containing protein n=1 Tax=Roseobacteraceae TaxID=2854170 RepID=UPI00126009F2|nr:MULTISPECIES: DUF4864 domain-containing protein [Roseobacteraceae]KAB6718133.1 DUF4864 domain-containing protein [Roseobacter sp. TSBP12]|tara:strand:+ start:8826 stop:9221 length:396 start_codon:yes stop_codon:yes gene_type:complete
MFKALITATVLGLAPLVAVADEMTDVISDQLQAFQKRDVGTAWEYASPMIQGQFVDPRSFAHIVEQGYGPIWNNATVRFGMNMVQDGRVIQTVIVTDQTGQTQGYEYDMIETDAGWKVNGVRPIDVADVAV